MAVTRIALADLAANLFTDTVSANAAIAVTTASTIIYLLDLDNTANAAEDNYVKIYNTAGAVTVGTTVPDDVIEVRQGTRLVVSFPQGKTLETGVAIATVTAGGTAGTTSPGSAFIVRLAYT